MVATNGVSASQQTFTSKPLTPIEGLQIRTLDDARVVERVRVLDEYCLAVKYTDNYYDTYVRPCAHPFNQIALYHDMLVGSCTCRLERTDNEDEFRLYVMTLAVLEPYRRLGIGTHLFERILKNVMEEAKIKITEVTLHVQVGSAAIEFYKSFGFDVMERVADYYTGLEECDAFILRKVIPQPRLEQSQQQQQQQQRGKGGNAKNGKKK